MLKSSKTREKPNRNSQKRPKNSAAGDKPIKVAIIGGGCASIAAAFELTRPEHQGKYHVTIYQMGWRLGGKGASGRGPSDRIEEHGLHIWLGFYENAFRLMRECYAELDRDPRTSRFADWTDAFFPDPHVGIADISQKGSWLTWTAVFPPVEGMPGDPLKNHNPFTMSNYLDQTIKLLRSLILGVQTRLSNAPQEGRENEKASGPWPEENDSEPSSPEALAGNMAQLVKYGVLSTMAGLIKALALMNVALNSFPNYPDNLLQGLIDFFKEVSKNVQHHLESIVTQDDEIRYMWEIIDVVFAILVGFLRDELLYDPRGLDAINDLDCRQWLLNNGASKKSVNSAFVTGLYDLALAYEGGNPQRPGLAAGQAVRGSLRMFFTYRGALFWKMRAGMGDVVFAPYYEVLKKRGVRFQFFHRLENVKLASQENLAPGEKPYIESLEFDVQAKIQGGVEYQPLIDVKGVPSWPSTPIYSQLINGQGMIREGWEFESHWDRRKVGTTTLKVTKDFDFVVLGTSVGVIPYVCSEIISTNPQWQAMVENVKTVATQAFQIWMRKDMAQLGWTEKPVTISAFVKPFDTWSDMTHCISEETWAKPPRSLAYFCNILSDPPEIPDSSDRGYPARREEEVQKNAIHYLNNHIHHFWPHCVNKDGQFQWDLLVDPKERKEGQSKGKPTDKRFNSQYWRANVNPTDRYVLALPGTLKYRISPLDNTYDNLTICGDWTDCGLNEGCVEAAVMSGRLAAHAISHWPPLEDIIGYDHP